jgi:SSS family solute:Na+ symporter
MSIISSSISNLDIIVLLSYIVLVVALGFWAGWRQKKSNSEAKDYFLAGKSLKWPVIGFSLFATNISCVHLVGLAPVRF